MGSPQSCVDQGQPGPCERNQKDAEETGDHRYFRQTRCRHGDYPFSSRGIAWDRKRKMSPRTSTPMPAKTKLAREGGEESSTSEESTRNQPASRSKKLKIFIPGASGPLVLDSFRGFARRLKYHNHARSIPIVPAAGTFESLSTLYVSLHDVPLRCLRFAVVGSVKCMG